jgi:hypothetical protein
MKTIKMKKTFVILLMVSWVLSNGINAQLRAPGVKWDDSYSFDLSNSFKLEAYAKNKQLMRTMNFKTHFQSDGENFDIMFVTNVKGNGWETIIDKKNEVGIQIIGEGGPAPTLNVGGYKYPAETDLKKLEIVPANETKDICGYKCKKYTYTYQKIFGEVWITDEIGLTNDLGVFRACKMAAKHNTLSVPGFVMEMTTEDAKGGKTIMTTVSLKNAEKYTRTLNRKDMSTSLNKVNYYIF